MKLTVEDDDTCVTITLPLETTLTDAVRACAGALTVMSYNYQGICEAMLAYGEEHLE